VAHQVGKLGKDPKIPFYEQQARKRIDGAPPLGNDGPRGLNDTLRKLRKKAENGEEGGVSTVHEAIEEHYNQGY